MARGSLPDAHRALVDALKAMRDADAPELHVYDLWRPDMALPGVWIWLAPGTANPKPNVCTVSQVDRFVVIVGVDPAATIDDDARRLLDYVQLVREALDPVLYGDTPLDGQKAAAWASGHQLALDKLGDVQVTTAELPIDVTMERTVNPAP